MPYSLVNDIGDDNTRILHLLSGEFNDQITCELLTEPVENMPPYEALSYTWGDPDKKVDITVNRKPFWVTVNLKTALRYLRYADRPRLLWVDAICINQTNLSEVSIQVQHMTQIYGLAAGVLAWVGIDDGHGLAAFDILQRTVDHDMAVQDTHLDVLFQLFQRPYWTRLWIVQELVLARAITFVCEHRCLPWPIMDRLFAHSASSAGKQPPLFETMPYTVRHHTWRLRHLWHTRQLRRAGRPLSLLQLLNKYNICRCLLPKDSVYALLGICSPTIRDMIRPDYDPRTSAAEDVFRRVTAACIVEQQNLHVLGLLRRYVNTKRDSDQRRPDRAMRTSWAGEWSAVRDVRPLVEPDSVQQMYAAAPPTGFAKEEILQYEAWGVLRVKGVVMDAIAVVKEEVDGMRRGLGGASV